MKSSKGHSRFASVGVKVFRVIREGIIDWKSIPEIKALEPDYLNQLRRAGKQFFLNSYGEALHETY